MTTITLKSKQNIHSYASEASLPVTIQKRTFRVKDLGSALTHFIAMIAAIIGTAPLLRKAASGSTHAYLSAFTIFILSMICLYAASTTYHTFDISESVNKVLRKIDHAMIFVLIAGSYTPVCLIVLGGKLGYVLLTVVWAIALIGMTIKALWITCPKWFSSIIYIAMGWVCLGVFGQLWNTLPHSAFLWLLAGGIIYTIGGVIYALKLPIFHNKHQNFGSHEIFHLFVMGGSICHFIFMYLYVA